MRIFGRRDDDTGDTGPVATYAAVLDGEHLWWHVDGHARLVLREVTGRSEVEVADDPFLLAGLTADAYEVLAGGRPVRCDTLPDRAPARTPLAADGTAQYAVTEVDRHLRILRRSVAPTARLEAVEVHDERIHLRVAAPPAFGADVRLLLLDEQDRVCRTLPGSGSRHHLSGSFGAEDLPHGHVGVLRVAVGTAEDWQRIRRCDTGLADPNHAVLLPELPDPERPGRVRARLRWSPDSLLALRLLDPTAQDAG